MREALRCVQTNRLSPCCQAPRLLGTHTILLVCAQLPPAGLSRVWRASSSGRQVVRLQGHCLCVGWAPGTAGAAEASTRCPAVLLCLRCPCAATWPSHKWWQARLSSVLPPPYGTSTHLALLAGHRRRPHDHRPRPDVLPQGAAGLLKPVGCACNSASMGGPLHRSPAALLDPTGLLAVPHLLPCPSAAPSPAATPFSPASPPLCRCRSWRMAGAWARLAPKP